MSVKIVVNILIIATTGCIISTGLSAKFRPPKIYLETEYSIHSNENFTIRCEASKPITWTYPNNSLKSEAFSQFFIRYENLNNKENKYVALLDIINASFVDTGFYYCHEKGADLNSNRSTSKIYLFVEDDEHLSTIVDEIETVYSTAQYEEAILPCRPTSADIDVKLYKSGDDNEGIYWEKILLGQTREDGSVVMFDPRYGFIFTKHAYEEIYGVQHIIYECNFFRNHLTQISTVIHVIQPKTTSIAVPHIEDLNKGHSVEGDTLTLNCTLISIAHFNMTWTCPNSEGLETGRIIESNVSSTGSANTYFKTLTIKNVTKADQGLYTCSVMDYSNNKNNNTIKIKIYDTDDYFINLMEENNVYNITQKAGTDSVQWSIKVDAHPIKDLEAYWYDNNNELIASSDGTRYKIEFSHTEAVLKINKVKIEDFGNYTLVVKNGFKTAEIQLFLTVTDRPTVHIKMNDFHLIGTKSIAKCTSAGYPPPKIFWFFKPCLNGSCPSKEILSGKLQRKGLQIISEISIKASETGQLTCFANNTFGEDFDTVPFYITDVFNGFNISNSPNLIEEKNSTVKRVAIGETVELYCSASVYSYTNRIDWYRGSQKIDNTVNSDREYVEKSQTKYSYKTKLILSNVTENDNYYCKVLDNNDVQKELHITLIVSEPKAPTLVSTNLGETLKMKLPEGLNLECYFDGIPKPNIIWYKDDTEITTDENRTKYLQNGQVLYFQGTIESDEGTYSCIAKNKVGQVSKKMDVAFTNKGSGKTFVYIVIGFLVLVLVFFVVVLTIKIKKERKLQAELKAVGLEHFEKGQVESLNPDLGIDDQAELLPYEKKWEFPREKLKLGKQLGSGAFGVVMKAEAEGIVDGEDSTTVAVKMVKRNADFTYLRALASELKIMVHLGKHINVVNLLGACTKNIAKRELLVIVEYCQYGNLHNYLLRHRDNFIDQVDMNTGKLDYTIGSEALDRSVSFSSNRSNSQSSKSTALKYITLQKNSPNSSDQGGHFNKLMADYRGAASPSVNYSVNTESTTIMTSPSGSPDDLMMTSNNSSVQPDWRSNYRGDYKGNVQPICTKDLLAWAFQVARAMEYLASRKVLHGDLAARNILLADNNVVKICDFGLAKNMYKNDNYKKKGNGPLPVKWMAVESIRDRIFSTQSDVWSFGIVLWEFFSLARTPYPGMEADERLYQKLLDGYRMDSPLYATREIYQLMLKCWEGRPLLRPTFLDLVDKISSMLDDSVAQMYIDLNDPYLQMNTHQKEENSSDYLAMCLPPDFENLSSPQHYINESADNEHQQQNGYMCMKPGTIFSPREMDGTIFTFDLNKPPNVLQSPELSPMLSPQSNESDVEASPRPRVNSFSNPSYHILPVMDGDKGEILHSADNYVNLPQSKSAIVSNAVVDKTEKYEKPYVNSNSRDWERIEV